MTTLVQLKSQHPEWCFSCGKWHLESGGIHTCFENPILAAILALVQQHEATISDLKADLEREQSALHLKEVYRKGLEAELAKAQETIQQQARELEEADRALVDSFTRPTASYESHAAYLAALSRHSARAQQAEAKEEE